MVMFNGQFLMSTELECLTSVLRGGREGAIDQLFEIMRTLAPTLPGPNGIFNGYGRIYPDCGHIELAACECASPYQLPLIVERQQRLIATALSQLEQSGTRLLLANNNHSGLLQAGCPIWGAHENYLTEVHPTEFGARILPFLVTRIYGGAGGIEYPTGNFLASVRATSMELATGGGTTEARAIHSTCREENHVGSLDGYYRYHSILGDGHRSQFNLALQFGATALAIKVAIFDESLPRRLAAIGAFPPPGGWVSLLRQLNVLATPGQSPRVDPLVIQTQRVYLDAARRYADRLAKEQELPTWIPRVIQDWGDTLAAMAAGDHGFLMARLDAFTKYEFFQTVLQQQGKSFQDLSDNRPLFSELALLDHSYHEFSNPQSVFYQLEEAGVLAHRVGEMVEPGKEPEPFVPETQTRATARARLIQEQSANRRGFMLNWASFVDVIQRRTRRLEDPFAKEFGPWVAGREESHIEPIELELQRIIDGIQRAYDRGNYERAHRRMECLQSFSLSQLELAGVRDRYLQLQIWIQARRGFEDGQEYLSILYEDHPTDIRSLNDFCCVYRFHGLGSDRRVEQWLQFGIEEYNAIEDQTPAGAAFREHAAYTHLKAGRIEQTREILEISLRPEYFNMTHSRIQGRTLATLGDTYRILSRSERALELLNRAKQVQEVGSHLGDLADMTFTGLAKWEPNSESALAWIDRAKDIQMQSSNQMGLARSLTLEARLLPNTASTADHYDQLTELRNQLPALASCELLKNVMNNWQAWVNGETLVGQHDSFWGI